MGRGYVKNRPLREQPVADEQEHQAMLARLKRRCDDVKAKQSIVGENPTGASDGGVAPHPEPTPSADGGTLRTGSPGDSFRPTRSAPNPSIGSGVAQPVAERDVEMSRLPGADQAAVAILEWERVGPYAMRTLCGTWTCCKVTVGGHTHYELWRRIAGLERPARALWDFLSFESAKESAQDEMD